jgi:hypothetical protein
MTEETYLGDGVYASFDGYLVWLRVTREGRDERVAIEPATFEALVSYVESIHAKHREAGHVTD